LARGRRHKISGVGRQARWSRQGCRALECREEKYLRL